MAAAANRSGPPHPLRQGAVMPIGAEEAEPGGEILERFVALAGGTQARIAVIPTASDDPQRSGEGYTELSKQLGAKQADWFRLEQRARGQLAPSHARTGRHPGSFLHQRRINPFDRPCRVRSANAPEASIHVCRRLAGSRARPALRLSTITQLRLQTRLLIRVACRLDDPVRDQLVAGLDRIDADISSLIRPPDRHEER